jgi:hypothetical protein
MGYSQSSLAVSGKSPEEVLSAIGLRSTGKREEFPESRYNCANLPNGWFLVIADRAGSEIIDEAALRQLSVGCDVIACSVEEHVMVSEASGWENGSRTWRVVHDAQRGMEHLEAEGEPPAVFPSIRNRLCEEQNAAGGSDSDTDYYFDIPVELAMSFTGYRHDKDTLGLTENSFEVLETVDGRKKSFFRRLFGS